MLQLTLELFKDLLSRPRGAYIAICRSPRAVYGAALIFLASLLGEAALLLFLPPGFMPEFSPEKITTLGLFTQLLAELASVGAITFFLVLFGSMARKYKGLSFALAAFGGLVIPMIAISSFNTNTPASIGLLFAIMALVAGGLLQFSYDSAFPLKRLVAVVLLANGLTLPLIPCQLAAGWFRSEFGYMAVTVVFSLWMIRFMISGAAYILRLSTARSAAVFIAGIFGVMLLISALAKTGVMPQLAQAAAAASASKD